MVHRAGMCRFRVCLWQADSGASTCSNWFVALELRFFAWIRHFAKESIWPAFLSIVFVLDVTKT